MLITAPLPLASVLAHTDGFETILPSNHGGEDSTGHVEHGVDVAVHHGLALGGPILNLEKIFRIVIAHPNIVH